jgi:hypothetical protein
MYMCVGYIYICMCVCSFVFFNTVRAVSLVLFLLNVL